MDNQNKIYLLFFQYYIRYVSVSRIGYHIPMFAGFVIMFVSTISKCLHVMSYCKLKEPVYLNSFKLPYI